MTLLIGDVEAQLRVGKRSIYRYIEQGRLHAIKQGKAYIFSQGDIDTFLAERDRETQTKLAEKRARFKLEETQEGEQRDVL